MMFQTHEEVMDDVRAILTVTTLSYEEVIALYLRGRGILQDGADLAAAPVPAGWTPPTVDTEEKLRISTKALQDIQGLGLGPDRGPAKWQADSATGTAAKALMEMREIDNKRGQA